MLKCCMNTPVNIQHVPQLINTYHIYDSGIFFAYEAWQLCSWLETVHIVLQHW